MQLARDPQALRSAAHGSPRDQYDQARFCESASYSCPWYTEHSAGLTRMSLPRFTLSIGSYDIIYVLRIPTNCYAQMAVKTLTLVGQSNLCRSLLIA